jgi:hypothetical protein
MQKTHYALCNLALDISGQSLDLILLPGRFLRNMGSSSIRWLIKAYTAVAFDRSLSRLGHGKGYYDRFITMYTAAHEGKRPLLGACSWCAQRRAVELTPQTCQYSGTRAARANSRRRKDTDVRVRLDGRCHRESRRYSRRHRRVAGDAYARG